MFVLFLSSVLLGRQKLERKASRGALQMRRCHMAALKSPITSDQQVKSRVETGNNWSEHGPVGSTSSDSSGADELMAKFQLIFSSIGPHNMYANSYIHIFTLFPFECY